MQAATHAALQAFGDSTWERKFGGLVEQASQVGFASCCSKVVGVTGWLMMDH